MSILSNSTSLTTHNDSRGKSYQLFLPPIEFSPSTSRCCARRVTNTYLVARREREITTLKGHSRSLCTRIWSCCCSPSREEIEGCYYFFQHLQSLYSIDIQLLISHLHQTLGGTTTLRIDRAKVLLTTAETLHRIRPQVEDFILHLKIYLYFQVLTLELFHEARPFTQLALLQKFPHAFSSCWWIDSPTLKKEGKVMDIVLPLSLETDKMTLELAQEGAEKEVNKLLQTAFPAAFVDRIQEQKNLIVQIVAKKITLSKMPEAFLFFFVETLFELSIPIPIPPQMTHFNVHPQAPLIAGNLLTATQTPLTSAILLEIYLFVAKEIAPISTSLPSPT